MPTSQLTLSPTSRPTPMLNSVLVMSGTREPTPTPTLFSVVNNSGLPPNSMLPPTQPVRLTAVADKGSTDRCDGEDWVAFANTGNTDVSLAGYVLHDDKGPGHNKAFTFAAGATIAAGATNTLCKDGDGSFEFGVGGDDTVTLRGPSGAVVDSTGELGDQGELNYVWTRNGTGWEYQVLGMIEPTPTPTALTPTMAPNENGVFHQIDVYMFADIWDLHASCRFGESKREPRPAHCDYQPANCSHNGMAPRSCLVRRKGSGTWRDLDDKPSLKIKDFNDDTNYEFARYPCATTSSCNSLPTGSLASSDTNVWATTKLTLNNRVHSFEDGETNGYKFYRDADLIAPLAEKVSVRLYRTKREDIQAQLVVGPALYNMIETINDRAFLEKHFGEDYVLWEVENNWWNTKGHVSLFKRDGGVLEGELQSYTSNSTVQFNRMSETSFDMSYMQRFLAAELVTGNSDAACAANSNHYIAATPREGQGPLFTWIPHGIDRAFGYQSGPSCRAVDGGYCPVAACLQRAACAANYCSVYDAVEALPHPWKPPSDRDCGVKSVCDTASTCGIDRYLACKTSAVTSQRCDSDFTIDGTTDKIYNWCPTKCCAEHPNCHCAPTAAPTPEPTSSEPTTSEPTTSASTCGIDRYLACKTDTVVTPTCGSDFTIDGTTDKIYNWCPTKCCAEHPNCHCAPTAAPALEPTTSEPTTSERTRTTSEPTPSPTVAPTSGAVSCDPSGWAEVKNRQVCTALSDCSALIDFTDITPTNCREFCASYGLDCDDADDERKNECDVLRQTSDRYTCDTAINSETGEDAICYCSDPPMLTPPPTLSPTPRPTPIKTSVPTALPTTSEPTTSEPTTSEPITSEPTTSTPITSAPATSAPTTSAPATSEPTTADPTTSEPTSEPATPSTAVPLTLVDARTSPPTDLLRLESSSTINSGSFGTDKISIRYEYELVSDVPPGSVTFVINGVGGSFSNRERSAPYSLLGDKKQGRKFVGWSPAAGEYTLTVTVHAGSAGDSMVLQTFFCALNIQ